MRFITFFLSITFILLSYDLAFADDAIGDVFCIVGTWLSGNVGVGLATLGILIIGSGALLGKISWSGAIVSGTGISVIFGASMLATTLTGIAPASCGINISVQGNPVSPP